MHLGEAGRMAQGVLALRAPVDAYENTGVHGGQAGYFDPARRRSIACCLVGLTTPSRYSLLLRS
jgi:hypothetical protein